ncbi:LuxR C-terminal-related transcriptional regulator [Nocardioides sp. QY071]|nr:MULTISPECIES: LuxR C-terminal-related transcriptional regulator [unclassified Nocardioides]WGY02391.1 LuxR C-terminal-related transcriptional regulator [Nocardioides sp. QY071]
MSMQAEDLYRNLVAGGPTTVETLSARVGLPAFEVEVTLDELELIGLAERDRDHAVARPPYPVLDLLATERAAEAARAHQMAQTLSELWRQHHDDASYLQVLQSDAACDAAQDALIAGATREVRALSIGPVGDERVRPEPTAMAGFYESIARGVSYKIVYGAAIVQHPVAISVVRSCIDAGEEARLFPEVPVNLTIADDHLGLVTLPRLGDRRRDMLVVHPSSLLEVLSSIFWSYWRQSSPLTVHPHGLDTEEPVEAYRSLLTLLAAGLTDDAIARELGVSDRTVRRRLAHLQEVLGAASRFQLGVQAARNGWL